MTVRVDRWNAIGTNVDLLVNDGPVAPARKAVEQTIEEADRTYSRFRSDSELSRLNQASGMARAVSPLLAQALSTAFRAAQLSDGLVDPTVGRVLRLAGYDADFATVALRHSAPVVRIESISGWVAVDWNPDRQIVRLPRGVELDLGATGKALIADRAAASALSVLPEGAGVLVSIGGDIRVAGSAPRWGWRVLMAENSRDRRKVSGELASIRTGAIATSSTTVRSWRRGRAVYHHLIDPRTTRPAAGPWRTVSVAAATCVDANIGSAAAVLLGDEAIAWLNQRGLPARLVSRAGEIRYTGGWGQSERAVA